MKVEVGQYRLNQDNGKTYRVIERIDDWHYRIKYEGNKRETVFYVGRVHMDAVWVDEPEPRQSLNALLNQILC